MRPFADDYWRLWLIDPEGEIDSLDDASMERILETGTSTFWEFSILIRDSNTNSSSSHRIAIY